MHPSVSIAQYKFAIISGAATDNTVVAAVTGKKIRVVNLCLLAASSVNVRFESGTAGTALTGVMSLAANGGFAPGFAACGHFETAATTLLNMELSSTVQVSGWVVYQEV